MHDNFICSIKKVVFGCDFLNKIKRIIKKIDQKTINILPGLKRLILRIRPAEYYVNRSNYLLDNNEPLKANKLLSKGLKHYKESYYLNQLKAIIETEYGNKKQANDYWKAVIKKHSKRASVEDYIQYSVNLIATGQQKHAITILEKGLTLHTNNTELLKMVSEQYVKLKRWNKVKSTLSILFVSDEYIFTVKNYINLSYAYYIGEETVEAEYIIQQGVQAYKKDSELLLFYIDLCTWLNQWKKAAILVKYLSSNIEIEYSNEQLILFGMIHQLIGDKKGSDYFYDDVLIEEQVAHSDEIRHQKLTLFDNGETRIDFYKRNTKTNKIIITFDSLRMTWDKPSFGFKLLSEQNIDIIAVQKREKETYHQDLSLKDFLNAVELLVKGYKKRISYGFSLGAYLVVYYTGALDCIILSLAPRLSIHPIFGKKSNIGEMPFYHTYNLKKHPHVRPIIVYDPKDKIDNRFVENEILNAYPAAHLVKLPYGGHAIGPHLQRMGLLKKFILTVIHDEQVPVYDRTRKERSANYNRLLGRECFRRGKIKWAQELSNRAYALLPKDTHVVRLKVDILVHKGKFEDAEECLNSAIESKPNSLPNRLALIDIYVRQGNFIKARIELENLSVIFGERKEINIKREKVQKELKGIVKNTVNSN